MNHVKKFNSFKLNESHSPVHGIEEFKDGGYEITVSDLENSRIYSDKICISGKNENAICLSYYDDDDNKKESIWISKVPGVGIIKKGDSISKVKIDGKGRWMSKERNRAEIEEFIDSFYDHIDGLRSPASVRVYDTAKDDVETVLDILGIPGKIKNFNKVEDYEWEAHLSNDIIINITKRSKSDLVGTFKVYKNSEANYPSIDIRNSKSSKESRFDLNKEVKVSEDIGFPGIKSKDPYYRYLIKKSLGIQTEKEEDSFVLYFKELAKKESGDTSSENKHFENVKKAVSLIISNDEIQEIVKN